MRLIRSLLTVRARLAALLVLLSLLLGFPEDSTGQDAGGATDLEARVADLFERRCATSGCHAGPVPQMEMDLTRDQFFAATVGQPSRERPDLLRVHPGQPDSSYLLMKIRGAEGIVGVPMPFTGDRLTEDEVAAVEAWIASLEAADTARARQPVAAEAYPFTGWKVINLPTTRTVDQGSWLFFINHRFGPKISDGYEAFFGLDGSAIILLSLGYAVTDELLFYLARSNAADDVELQVRYRLAHQGGRSPWPLAVSAVATGNWITEDLPDDADPLKFTGQVSLTRAFGDRISLAVVPGILFNADERTPGEDPLVTIGLGGRWRFWRNLSIIGEWVPIVSGYTRTSTFGYDNRFDSWGAAFEITVGGHVFQIVVSNSVGLATDQYLRGGDLDLRDGDVRLGFNIFRILNF
jgi:hypothetical protein